MLHGPYGEDGTVQGLLELANVPYVGAGRAGLGGGHGQGGDEGPVCRRAACRSCAWHGFVRAEWDRDRAARARRQIGQLGLPVFVKPANLGSSVGISKVKTRDELVPAIETGARIRSQGRRRSRRCPNAREIECAVLGNDDPETSVPGEIIPSREFYDYEAKYLDEGSQIGDSGRPAGRDRRGGAAAGDRGVPRDRRGRPGARGLPAGARHRRDLRQRDQHHARLHHDQHVLEDVGGQRRELRRRSSIG